GEIDEAMKNEKTHIDLAILAFQYADAGWWSSEEGFSASDESESAPSSACFCGGNLIEWATGNNESTLEKHLRCEKCGKLYTVSPTETKG
nr:hypothetical protein [Clostridia bacterium]